MNDLNQIAKTANENGVFEMLLKSVKENRVQKSGWSFTGWKLDNYEHSEPITLELGWIGVVFSDCILIEGLYTFDKNYFINIKAN